MVSWTIIQEKRPCSFHHSCKTDLAPSFTYKCLTVEAVSAKIVRSKFEKYKNLFIPGYSQMTEIHYN